MDIRGTVFQVWPTDRASPKLSGNVRALHATKLVTALSRTVLLYLIKEHKFKKALKIERYVKGRRGSTE